MIAEKYSKMRVIENARSALARNPVFLDTETTGLDDDAEVVEIALLNHDGTTLLNTLIRPAQSVPVSASAIHGIKDSDLINAPAWSDVHQQFCELTKDRLVMIYNSEFDNRLIRQSSAKYGLTAPVFFCECVMLAYAEFAGVWREDRRCWRWHKLADAAKNTGYLSTATAHRALEDCRMTAHILQAIAAAKAD